MLEHLEEIDWSKLSHAYGPAADVPGQLRSLLDPAQCEASLHALFGNVWHQGTIYEATAFAVPFLLEIASDPATPGRHDVLSLIGAIATGSSYHKVHQRYSKTTRGVDAKIRKETQWVARAHSAIAAGFTSVMAMTSDASPAVRLAAAHVLVCIPEKTEAVADRLLMMRRTETVLSYRAGLLLLMGDLRPCPPPILDALNEALASNEKAAAAAAAVSLALLKKNDLPAKAIELLKYYAKAEGEFQKLFEVLPWDFTARCDLEALAERFITPQDQSQVVELLIAQLPSPVAVRKLVDQVFPMRRGTVLPQELSPVQRQVLRAVAAVVEQDLDFDTAYFIVRGLPSSRQSIRALAEGKPMPVTDRSLPVLARPQNMHEGVDPQLLSVNDSVVHRVFGPGIVRSTTKQGPYVRLLIDFGAEGRHELMLRANPPK